MMLSSFDAITDLIWLMIRSDIGSDNDMPFIKAAILRYLIERDDNADLLKGVYDSVLDDIIKARRAKRPLMLRLIETKLKYWRPSLDKITHSHVVDYRSIINKISYHLNHAYGGRLPQVIIAKVIVEVLKMFHNKITISVERSAIFVDEPMWLFDDLTIHTRCNIVYTIIVNGVAHPLYNIEYEYSMSDAIYYLEILVGLVTLRSCMTAHVEPCVLADIDMTTYESSLLAEDGLCTCEFMRYFSITRAIGILTFDRFGNSVQDGHTELRHFTNTTPIHLCAKGNSIHTVTVAGLVDNVVQTLRVAYGKK